MDADTQCLRVVIVNHVEPAKHSTVTEAVTHEVDRLGLIRPDSLARCFQQFGSIGFLEPLTRIKFHAAIQEQNAFIVPLLNPSWTNVNSLESRVGMSLGQRSERVDKDRVAAALGRVPLGRAPDSNDSAGSGIGSAHEC